MSKENLANYRQGIDAYNRRDLDAFLAFMDPGVEFAARISGVEGPVSGHAGVRSWWAKEEEAFDGVQVETRDVLDRGEWVIASGTTHLRGSESGVKLEVPWGHATRWRDGKCIRFQSVHTLQEALEAAGLSE